MFKAVLLKIIKNKAKLKTGIVNFFLTHKRKENQTFA